MKVSKLIHVLAKLPPDADITVGVLDDEWNDDGGIFELEPEEEPLALEDGSYQLSVYVDIEETGADFDNSGY